jgi:hypothetical protein
MIITHPRNRQLYGRLRLTESGIAVEIWRRPTWAGGSIDKLVERFVIADEPLHRVRDHLYAQLGSAKACQRERVSRRA